jgi:hypothetical protein
VRQSHDAVSWYYLMIRWHEILSRSGDIVLSHECTTNGDEVDSTDWQRLFVEWPKHVCDSVSLLSYELKDVYLYY